MQRAIDVAVAFGSRSHRGSSARIPGGGSAGSCAGAFRRRRDIMRGQQGSEIAVDFVHRHNLVDPDSVPQERRYGIRVTLPPNDTFSRLLGSDRSEEHTSELQSREKLVCRLLLEKKNTNNRI